MTESIVSYNTASLYDQFETMIDSDETEPWLKNKLKKLLINITETSNDEILAKILVKMSKSDLIGRLKVSIYYQDVARTKLILATGIIPKDDPSTIDILGNFHPFRCVSSAYVESSVEVIKMLTGYGFNNKHYNYKALKFFLGNNCVCAVEAFLDSGIDVNVTFAKGGNPLKRSLKRKKYAVAEMLINRGANVTGVDTTHLPENIRALIDERLLSPIELFQKIKNDVNKAISVMSFTEYKVVTRGIYYKLINDYCDEFNSVNEMFKISFDEGTSTLLVEFAQ